MIRKIPKPIIEIIRKLEAAGFEAFVVGGCVRDLLLKKGSDALRGRTVRLLVGASDRKIGM